MRIWSSSSKFGLPNLMQDSTPIWKCRIKKSNLWKLNLFHIDVKKSTVTIKSKSVCVCVCVLLLFCHTAMEVYVIQLKVFDDFHSFNKDSWLYST